MAFIRTAVQFFKTWFLPLPAHDDEGGTVTPLHTWPEQPAKPAI